MSDVKLGTGQLSQLVTPVNLDGTVIVGGGGGGGGGGDASAANQTAVQALAGSDASKAIAVQGITNGKAIPVTANAGINLNTSALALESGGNLAGINSKLILPASLGAKPASQSLPVTLSTDGVASGIAAQIGEVQSTPTANTVLARLKTLSDILTLPAAYLFTATVTRPADTLAYSANTVYGGAFQLTSTDTAPSTGSYIVITDIDIIFNLTAVPSGMSSFVFYPYNVTPPSAIANRGAFSIPSGDSSAIIYPSGFTLSAVLARGGGSVVAQLNNINVVARMSGASLFAYLVTTGAFTPAANSESFTIRVRAVAA